MPADPLREKLLALVEEWRREAGYENVDRSEAAVFKSCSRELSALLAKSEPGMDPAYPPANIAANIRREEMANPGKTHYQGDSCPGGHESKCGYCGAKCERCTQPAQPEPVLKLGHEFEACPDHSPREV